jgi:hypothetical protein
LEPYGKYGAIANEKKRLGVLVQILLTSEDEYTDTLFSFAKQEK